ncbi:MAG: YbdK family carboxylate-amine ligase [Candidatus Marinimicrobia bacterium]|nr:YbdK family carboxylate-amine ligase [Candidatus Neomarinimicrobiota bacterium]MCF7828994.1 YbdK family carboxylate-amine ligase [Candidatus Neomarinimicrobiota bacterium]MCF7879954.1 YbdK family carboxylate-amine ligase [Candidatus Neomarinimicrobiota bacterium]
MHEEKFEDNSPLTLGVEEEFMFCDTTTGDLTHVAEDFMNEVDPELRDRFSYELLLSEIETNTDVARDVDECMDRVIALRKKVAEICDNLGVIMGVNGTHPFADWRDQQFVRDETYQWVANQLHYYARRNITYGLHVHVGVNDPELAIHMNNGLRRWLAPLLALSGNSPFFEGRPTGMYSTRTMQFGAFPRTNIPPAFHDFAEYDALINKMIESGTIQKPRQIWWKIRPHVDFGTIEFRVCDVQNSLERTRFFVALSQALVGQTLKDFQAGQMEPVLQSEYLNDALWKANRFGLDCDIIGPNTGNILSMRDAVEHMVEYASPMAEELGTLGYLETVEEILETGNEAQYQLRLYEELGQDVRRVHEKMLQDVKLDFTVPV